MRSRISSSVISATAPSLSSMTAAANLPGHATESQVIDAIWSGRSIERSTLWNRISKARAVLGRFIPAHDQGPNLVRLAAGVKTDTQLFQSALDSTAELSTAHALDQLLAAL